MQRQGRPLIDTISPHNTLTKAALYYIRLDTQNSALFDKESAATMPFAQIAIDELQAAADRKGIRIEKWAVCPKAMHVLVYINENRNEQDHRTGKPRALTSFVAGVKAATAKRINLVRNKPGHPVWKRSYKEQRVENDRVLSQLEAQMQAASSS